VIPRNLFNKMSVAIYRFQHYPIFPHQLYQPLMKFRTVTGTHTGQLEVDNLFLIGNTEADLILPGEFFQGINQFMQIGYISVLIAGLTDAD